MQRTLPYLLALLILPFLAACTNTVELAIRNDTISPLTATLRVDRIGPKGTTLATETIRPNAVATFGPLTPPPLEYIELVITRPGDLGNVPVSRRIPTGYSDWTITRDPESWAGFSIIEGIDEP